MKTTNVVLAGMVNMVKDSVASWRRIFHSHPEIRWQEDGTLASIKGQVEKEVTNSPLLGKFEITEKKGGLVVDLLAVPGEKFVLFRADVDALEIQEDTGLPYSSCKNGLMHGCGHDMHAAMLLGAIAAICRNGKVPEKNIRFVFQRAEENPITESGGACLVKEGVLTDVSEAHALHVWVKNEVGHFACHPGVALGNSDRMQILIETAGGHVAMPESGTNALDIVTDILVGLRGFSERTLGPMESTSLVPAIVKSGTGSNIRPAAAEMWFAVRNFLGPKERAEFHQALANRVLDIAAVYKRSHLKVTVNMVNGHPTMENTAPEYEKVKRLLEDSGLVTEVSQPMLGGEDFAWYLKRQGGVPGTMWTVGAKQENCGDFHTPKFNPNEGALEYGVLFWLLLAYSK